MVRSAALGRRVSNHVARYVAANHPSRRPLRGLLRMRLSGSPPASSLRLGRLALVGRLVVLLDRRLFLRRVTLLEARLDVVEQFDLRTVLLHDDALLDHR